MLTKQGLTKQEIKKIYNEKYYKNHHDKILEKVNCNICGVQVRKYDLKVHQKTKGCCLAKIN
jgi:hypothetical protein